MIPIKLHYAIKKNIYYTIITRKKKKKELQIV